MVSPAPSMLPFGVRRRNQKRFARDMPLEGAPRAGAIEFPTKVGSDTPVTAPRWPGRTYLAAIFVAALLVAFNLYYPALSGPFVFDDFTLPYKRTVSAAPLSSWLEMAGVRPVLILTYWLNHKLTGDQPQGYHVANLLIHGFNTVLVFLVLYRLLQLSGWIGTRRSAAAAIGAAVFLVHPLQTESVSYIAGRSESLAALFMLLAYLVFVYRRDESISWRGSLAVLLLS